jgi:hypothetical protein
LAVTLDILVVVGVLPAQPVVHLDAGYDHQPCRQAMAERTHAWSNQYGKLRWCTERRRLVRRTWTCYRWQARPRRRP